MSKSRPTNPKLEFRWATLAEVRAAGADDLAVLHWEEIEGHHDASPIDIDWKGYAALERAGTLKIASLWKGDRLIGYNVFFVYRPLHSRTTLWAISDVLYVDPEHRRGWTGVKLLKESELGLKAMGAKVILYSVKTNRNLSLKRDRDSVGLLLEKLGYGSFDQSWSKSL